ncbi:hypothetical protein HMPREF7215_0212 [Pyramidobacter piscolens W5455]|uniref:Uncharacterized protein n=1 Tax=Pyramidobacter piscolens W5455 TaxID=352165 RepID=A0ABM9ZR99_9BACT|nr:hypothetical protein HMPREF7215_0212 [Pyramidobacter piscolens W5455]
MNSLCGSFTKRPKSFYLVPAKNATRNSIDLNPKNTKYAKKQKNPGLCPKETETGNSSISFAHIACLFCFYHPAYGGATPSILPQKRFSRLRRRAKNRSACSQGAVRETSRERCSGAITELL